jgi:serine/threonine protein kinase
MEQLVSPAEELVGLSLDGGWKVISRIQRPPGATGGFFSQSYIVESQDGGNAFLKALDFTAALSNSDDPARVLQALTQVFNYERDLLAACKDRRLSRVVTVVAEGKVRVRNTIDGLVQYLIFEQADGDARTLMDASEQFDISIRLRALHHVATGLRQLHGLDIAHQDMKPSNVLMFSDGSKVGDLGCASQKGNGNPRDECHIIGDPTYAPPELLYYHVPADWDTRRFACDLYLMGSMIAYFFTGSGFTPLWRTRLHASHDPNVWSGGYADVLPFVRDAFDSAVREFEEHVVNPKLQRELSQMLQQLCDPDPLLRGHPSNRMGAAGNRYSLERYVSHLDLLSRRASIGEYRA